MLRLLSLNIQHALPGAGADEAAHPPRHLPGGDVVARQLSLVLNDSVRPRVFRDVALQEDISGIDHVPQGVANERHG